MDKKQGLTILFQDDIPAFVLPDDGGGQRADHVAHDHSIVPLLELLRGGSVLEHQLFWKMGKDRVTAASSAQLEHRNPQTPEISLFLGRIEV